MDKKILYMEIDDEITTIYDRVKRVRQKEIVLVVPKHAVLFSSVVNLKILKRKTDELEKNIAVMTNDPSGKKLCGQVGFELTERFGIAFVHKEASPTPARPTKFSEQKYSLSELLKRGEKTASPWIAKIKEFIAKRKKKKKYATEVIIITPNKRALVTLVVICLFVLVAIAYIALPGATITLTPASVKIEQPLNITLADFEKFKDELESRPKYTIPSFRLKPPTIQKIFTYPATGKIFQGGNAKGTLTIHNESNLPWPLVTQTRFQTEEGIVFRIKQPVTVPPTQGAKPGTLDTEVVADEFDVNGQVVGERGNIPPARFFLPGLKNPENQKKLSGVSVAAMAGGFTKVVKTVSQDDLKAALERAKQEITLLARDELKTFVEKQNIERGVALTLLEDERTILIDEPRIEIDPSLASQETEEFEVKTSVDISGVTFHKREFLNVLRDEMKLRKSPDKEIIQINEGSLTYKILEINENASRIKLTATLRGIEQYSLNLEDETGLQFLKKITDHVVGKDIDEATFYIQNLPEIERVEIKSWPFWAPTIPTVPDNIEFVITPLPER